MGGKKFTVKPHDPDALQRVRDQSDELVHRQAQEKKEAAARARDAATRARVFVCSDVHLGTDNSRSDAFYAWLDERQPGDTAILLGDILDMWIYDGDYVSGDLEAVVASQWGKLWDKLSDMRDKDVEIHYIPGNHDTFAFYIEAEPYIPWCAAVLKNSQTFQRVRDATAKKNS